jgi:hypothetical protein
MAPSWQETHVDRVSKRAAPGRHQCYCGPHHSPYAALSAGLAQNWQDTINLSGSGWVSPGYRRSAHRAPMSLAKTARIAFWPAAPLRAMPVLRRASRRAEGARCFANADGG